MNELTKRLCRAAKAELRRQEVIYEDDNAPDEDLGRLMFSTGACADLPALVLAIVAATRVPTTEMTIAGADDGSFTQAFRTWQLMIDAIGEEK